YCGHRFRDRIFAFARWLGRHWRTAVIGLIAWAIVEQLAVMRGLPETPGATLLFGLAGGVAVIAVAVILDRARRLRWLAYCARNSLIIYLSFFAPMAAARALLIRTGWIVDVGVMSLVVAVAAVATPLAASALVRRTVFDFLYTRPSWARLDRRRRPGAALPAS